MHPPEAHESASADADADADDRAHLEPGVTLGQYRIAHQIGRGASGSVYAATDVATGRPVALKVVPSEAATRGRFIRETTHAAALTHPHILPIVRSGEQDGLLYIAMRLIYGLSLREMVEHTGPLHPRRAVRIIAAISGALDAIHELGLMHRDVTPANILIATSEPGDHAYLADFGLATAIGDKARWAGTLAYTAPEQLAGTVVDGRADTYALGCTLFFALSGHPPYPVADEADAYLQHATAPVPRLQDFAPEVPVGLNAVIHRALAKDPAQRFVTTGALGRAALFACRAL